MTQAHEQQVESAGRASSDLDFPASAPPLCIIVTGPRGAGKTRWLLQRLHTLAAEESAERCAVLLAEEGRTGAERLLEARPGVAVRKLFLPCMCCPMLAQLPSTARMLTETGRVARLFLELPAVAAAGLIAEFDQVLGWPRRIVVCLNEAWRKARDNQALSPFQTGLLALADQWVENAGSVMSCLDVPAGRPLPICRAARSRTSATDSPPSSTLIP